MIGDVYDRASSLLERRFLKNALLPVALLPLAIAWPYLVQHDRLKVLARWWDSQSAASKLVLVLIYFAASWFLGAIVASQWRNIIRLFEGYPFVNTVLGRLSSGWYLRRRKDLNQSNQHVWKIYYEFPKANRDIMPTRLGNILKAAERYPFDRYGAETIILWPRLNHLLPPEFVADVEDARATVEFLLVTALFWTAFGSCSFALLAISGSPAWLSLFCFLLGLTGARLAYQSCLPAAVEYGEQLRAGVELHRLTLLTALKLREPRSLAEEKAIWAALLMFVSTDNRDIEQYRADGVPPDAAGNLP